VENAVLSYHPKTATCCAFETKNGHAPQHPFSVRAGSGRHHAKVVFAEVAARVGIDRSQIVGWILHAGGREVLNALQEAFALPDEACVRARRLWRNLEISQSVRVVFAASGPGARCSRWIVVAFFFWGRLSCHGALLEVG